MTIVTELWDRLPPARAERTALAGGSPLSYAALARAIQRAAAGFATAWRLQPGEVVAILAPNCPEFVIAYFAILSRGAIAQPIDVRLRPDEIARLLEDSGARGIVAHAYFAPALEALPEELRSRLMRAGIGDPEGADTLEHWLAEDPAPAVPHPTAADDLAELMYTAGTAGEPKGVMRSHGAVLAAAGNAIRGFGYRPDDVIAIAMPLSHSSALTSQLLPILLLGGTVVLLDRFEVDSFIAAIRAERVTCMRAVPTMLRLLLAAPDFRADALPSLRLIVNSSAPIDAATLSRVKARFPDVHVLNSYGLTEASTCTVLPDDLAGSHTTSVGRPIDGVDMQVVAPNGEPAPVGAVGEVWVRGPHTFSGYWGRPGLTARAVSDGWLRTGDLGYRDEQGLYYLQGRRDDLIICGGRKVVPEEVEACLLELSDVAEAAVVGAPHRMLGQVVHAFVVPREGASIDRQAIVAHCARRLPSHMVPFAVRTLSALPRNSVGKLVRLRLRELPPDAADMRSPQGVAHAV